MVLTAQAGVATSREPSRYALSNDILWDDEPDQYETPPSAPAPLGSGAERGHTVGSEVTAA